jgi:hypothetical protein
LFPANYVTKITENKKILNTKVIQRNTIESLNQPTLNSNAIREWTPEQVSLWILQIGFDHDIAYNFKGFKKRNVLYYLLVFIIYKNRSGN